MKIIVEKSTKTITPIRERFRSKAEKPKRSEKSKVVSGNGPNMDEPTTTAVDDLEKKGDENRPRALQKYWRQYS